MSVDESLVPWYNSPLLRKYITRYMGSNMDCTIKIVRGAVASDDVVYAGSARIHRLTSAVQMGFGDEPQYMVAGTISIQKPEPGEPIPQANDTIIVLEASDDRVYGRTFRVMHVDMGGNFHQPCTMSVMTSEDSPTVIVPPYLSEPDLG